MTKKHRARAGVLALALCCMPLGFVATAGATGFADPQPIAARTIEGAVRSKAGPLPGAVVYLKDEKSLAVRSFIADDGGAFHFGQLSANADYDLWAESAGRKSKTKRISAFNDKTNLDYTLEID